MAVSADWFRDWFNSPYYNQLYTQRDDNQAAAFVNQLVGYLKPGAGSFLLDTDCRTGSLTQALALAEYDVTGIDLSFYNIDEAGKRESERLHFFQHDLRLPFWMSYFHYAFNLSSRFGYLNSMREHHNVIRTIANALKANGHFIIDYPNTQYVEDNLVNTSEKEINGVHFNVTSWHDKTHFYRKVIVEDGQRKEPLVYQERSFKFSLDDFKKMFSLHHLQLSSVFGTYQFGDYDIKTSPRLILVAKKN